MKCTFIYTRLTCTCKNNAIPGFMYCGKHILKQPKAVGSSKFSIAETKFVEYKEYIKSPEWISRANKERTKNPSCSLCNSKGVLVVHHRTYVRLGKENDSDLVVLCKGCHSLFHSAYIYSGEVGHFIRR